MPPGAEHVQWRDDSNDSDQGRRYADNTNNCCGSRRCGAPKPFTEGPCQYEAEDRHTSQPNLLMVRSNRSCLVGLCSLGVLYFSGSLPVRQWVLAADG